MNISWRILFVIFVTILEYVTCKHSHPSGKLLTNFKSQKEHNTKPEFTIKLMIHLDKALTNKLATQYKQTAKQIKLATKHILLDVQNIYQHSSLNLKINFELMDIKCLKNITNVIASDENASNYLKNYCKWQAGKKRNGWYYSVLLTGLDLFYIQYGKEVRRSTGRGYESGMCSVKKSCTILEWHPKNAGYLLAHEIAHSIGIAHDGPPYNNCKSRGHIMGAKYNAWNHPTHWSPCSRRALKIFLMSKKSWCLRTEYMKNLSVM